MAISVKEVPKCWTAKWDTAREVSFIFTRNSMHVLQSSRHSELSVMLFAGDTSLFVHAKDLNSAIEKANKCLI